MRSESWRAAISKMSGSALASFAGGGRYSRFWRSVLAVLTGMATAQFIPIAASLVIARQYAPAEFGVFFAWLGLVAVAAVMVTGRFETSFAINADGEPRRMAVISTLTTTMLSMVALSIAVVIVYLAHPIWIRVTSPILYVLFIPAVMLAAMAQIWQVWAATEGKYRQLSTMRICQAISVAGVQIGAGTFFPSALALAIAYSVGVFIAVAVSCFLLPLGSLPRDLVSEVRRFWARFSRFPLYSLPADAINTMAGQLPILVVASRFGPEVTGLLAFTMRTLGGPISLLGTSVLDVFKRQAAASYLERGECRSDYLQTLLVLGGGSVCMVIVLVFASEPLFAFVFGERWRPAGTIAIWLLPMFAMRFVASPLSYMVYIVEKQHMDLAWQICLLVMTIVTLNLPGGYPVVLKSYSAGYTILYVAYLAMSYRFSLGEKR